LAVKINGNRGAQQDICFNKSFKRNCTISTGIPNLGVWCKKRSNWTSGVGQKIRLRLPVLLGIRIRLLMTPTAVPLNSTQRQSIYTQCHLARTRTSSKTTTTWWLMASSKRTPLPYSDELYHSFSRKTWSCALRRATQQA